MGTDRAAEAHEAFADFLENHGEGGVVQTHAAIFFRDRNAEQAQLFHGVYQFVLRLVVPVLLGGHGLNIAAHKLPHHVYNLSSGFLGG